VSKDVADIVREAERKGTYTRALGLYDGAYQRLSVLVNALPDPHRIRSGSAGGGTLPRAESLRELVKVLESGVTAMNEAADAADAYQALDGAQRLGGTTV